MQKRVLRYLRGWISLRPLLVSLLLLNGCAFNTYRAADTVIADAHGGGSALAISPDSGQLASAGWGGDIRVWRLPDGAAQTLWQAHHGEVVALSFLSDRRLLSAGFDGNLVEWSLRGRKIRSFQADSGVTALDVDTTGKQAVTGHRDGSVRLWRLPELSAGEILGSHEGAVRAVAIAPSGDLLASSARDGKVRLWRLDGAFTTLPDPGSDARTLQFAPDGRHLYGAGWFDLFRWNLAQRSLVTLDTDHHGIINSILFDPSGSYLASISRQTDSSVLSLDPATGKTIQRFQRHSLCGGVVVISPDGRTMVTTSDDASVMIWNLAKESLPPSQ